MKESVAVAKEADAKKRVSPTRSDNSIHRVRNEHEMQLSSLRDVIGNIRRDGATPSVESIATQLSGMGSAQRAPVLLALQQTHGNRYVQRVVSGIHAKLVVGQPGDKYEQEADRVAEEVLQAQKISPRQSAITPDHYSRINHLKTGGQLLDTETRAFFEPRFGRDFGQVRVHTSSFAERVAADLHARAFTVGNHIVFGASQHSPSTTEGRRLLAHELTHVIQQTGSSSLEGAQGNSSFPGNLSSRAQTGVMNGPNALALHPHITPLFSPLVSRLLLQRAEAEPRTDPSCSNTVPLSLSGTFPDFARGTVYSEPFHAAEGRTITVEVVAQYQRRSGDTFPPSAEYFGVSVHQCCRVSDERIMNQIIGEIGRGSPNTIRSTLRLPDNCSWSITVDDDFVYYLRIRNSGGQGIPVRISYTVR